MSFRGRVTPNGTCVAIGRRSRTNYRKLCRSELRISASVARILRLIDRVGTAQCPVERCAGGARASELSVRSRAMLCRCAYAHRDFAHRLPILGKKTGSIDRGSPTERSHTPEFDFKSPGTAPDAGTPATDALRFAVP